MLNAYRRAKIRMGSSTSRGQDKQSWRKFFMFLRIIFLAFVGLFFILALDNHYNKKSEQAMANVSSTRAKLLHLAMQQVLLQQQIDQHKSPSNNQENVNQIPISSNSNPSMSYVPPQQQVNNPPASFAGGHAQIANQIPVQNPVSNQVSNSNIDNSVTDNSEYVIDRTVYSSNVLNTVQQNPHPLYATCNGVAAGPTVFVKTHKTGSSTLTNIIMRHADIYNLRAGLPPEGKWELGGYPAKLKKSLIEPYDLAQYDVMSHHFRLDIPVLQNIVPSDTRVITILRNTIDNVESAFGFFRDQEPFDGWMNGIEMSTRLDTFYNNPNQFYKNSDDWYFRAKNMLFFDMGYDPDRDNDDAYILNALNELDNALTFVLITDYFDESLVLLKHAMCWDWEDILYVKFKMRTDEAKTTVNPDLAEKIKNWNRADYIMYNHYNRTLWKRAEEYGLNRLKNDVAELQLRLKKAENTCIEAYEPFKKKPWILHAKPRRPQTEYCKRLAAAEVVYSDILKAKMYQDPKLSLSKPSRQQTDSVLAEFDVVQKAALHV